MAVKFTEETPRHIRGFLSSSDIEDKLEPEHVEQVAEIFKTPLTGSYNWDYTIQDDRITKLYELGKTLNWNVEADLDWSIPKLPRPDQPWPESPWIGYAPYDALSKEEKIDFGQHVNSWSLSQFLHGEQGALLVASQLVSCAPTYNAKLYAASQTFDEARHVEFFNKYLQSRCQMMYPVNNGLKSLLDKILTDHRWDLKFIGMQIIIEGLALAAFNVTKQTTPDPVLRDAVHLIIRDEARHVTFGVNYLEEFIKTLTDEEREERAMFAYEACVISRERLMQTDVWRHYGWNVEEARERSLKHGHMADFQRLLFTRILPNVKRIGLLTDKVRPLYEQLGVLDFESMPNDGDIDWVDMSRPLYDFREEVSNA